ncbi:MAG: hypothetical protein ACEPOV_05200 [Hyphomicrobiales bacterium]
MKQVIKILLTIVIVFLAYMVYNSIQEPIQFRKEKKSREKEVVARLKEIRNAETLYKSIYGKYTDNFDTLSAFLKDGEIPVVKIMPDPTDTTYTRTIRDTIGFIKAADSIFKKKVFNPYDIKYVPFTNKKDTFVIGARVIKKSGIDVNVFEVKTPYSTYLQGLDEQAIINITASQEQIEKYPGLKVGSLEEPSTDGNWE